MSPTARESLAGYVDGRPCKGVGDLLKRCQEPDLGRAYARIFAVFDDDRVREHLRLPASACKTQIRDAVTGRSTSRTSLQAVLLARNLETVLNAVLDVLGCEALRSKPSPLERDRILSRLVFAGTQEQRREVLALVPSLDYLVRVLAETIVTFGR